MRSWCSLLLLLYICSLVRGQAIEIRSPKPNEEICMGNILPIEARLTNKDSISRKLLAHITITNITTNVVVYDTFDILLGVAAGASVDADLPNYKTNINFLSQLGSFKICASVSALDQSYNVINDWPFGDTVCQRLFAIRTTNLPFNDAFIDYSRSDVEYMLIPDQRKWVSLGGVVYDGEATTWDPPPPRGGPFGPDYISSPVLRLDRSDVERKKYVGQSTGDTIISFPFNISKRTDMVLSFDFMRTGRTEYPGLWDRKTMEGPEHTVVNGQGQVVRAGDSLILEFKDPREPKCNPAKWDQIAGIDGGHDFEFQKFWMHIKDTAAILHITDKEQLTIPLAANYFDTTFRFRLRLKANDNSVAPPPKDDDDPWYIDNIWFHKPAHPELEVMWVRVVTPYSKLPFSAVSALPIYVKIRNALYNMVYTDSLKVRIVNDSGKTVYSQTKLITGITDEADTVIRMPDWNAQPFVNSGGYFTVHATVTVGYDGYGEDDETFSYFFLNVNNEQGVQEFALDNGINQIPEILQQTGAGAGFDGTTGSYAVKFILPHADTLFGTRVFFGPANGSWDQIQFSLYRDDATFCIPGDTIQTFLNIRKPEFNGFTRYVFPSPVVLPAGVYWLGVSQLSIDNYMVGGSRSRSGGLITTVDPVNPHILPIYSSPYGTQTGPYENFGDIRCMIAVESPAGSGQWSPWMPSARLWPSFPGSVFNQTVIISPTFTEPFVGAGAFIPMIRPVVGTINSGTSRVQKTTATQSPLHSIPNPLVLGSGSLKLSFDLPRSGHTTLSIYDYLGREVRTVVNGMLAKGEHVVLWDGKGADGKFVPPAMYLCHLTQGDEITTINIVVQ